MSERPPSSESWLVSAEALWRKGQPLHDYGVSELARQKDRVDAYVLDMLDYLQLLDLGYGI
jgi:hypothetical protein